MDYGSAGVALIKSSLVDCRMGGAATRSAGVSTFHVEDEQSHGHECGRPPLDATPYWWRRASEGVIKEARRAGTNVAVAATNMTTTVTAANVAGSVACTP